MKTNNKMLQYREKVASRIVKLKEELNELEVRYEKAKSDYHSLRDELNEQEMIELTRKLFGNLMKNKKAIQTELGRLRIEILEKKYANLYLHSDIKPFEVVEERTPNLYLIREMDATETEQSKSRRKESFVEGGFCGNFDNGVQEWDIVSNEENPVFRIRRHKDGCFYNIYGDKYLISDKPIKFYDFNF